MVCLPFAKARVQLSPMPLLKQLEEFFYFRQLIKLFFPIMRALVSRRGRGFYSFPDYKARDLREYWSLIPDYYISSGHTSQIISRTGRKKYSESPIPVRYSFQFCIPFFLFLLQNRLWSQHKNLKLDQEFKPLTIPLKKWILTISSRISRK